ncbi:MAG TPA: DUF1192 domain-containing protein [Caulobacteraceae bacterium]
MFEEAAEPRTARGQALKEALREDLEVYSVADLEERIVELEREIARVRAQLDKKRAGRSAADAMFKL